MHKASLLFIFEPCQGSKVRCLRSAPVRADRGPPDLVRRLALEKRMIPNGLAFFSSVGLGSKVRCLALRIRVLFCMHMTAGPDFTGLGLIGGAAEEEAFQCGTVKGEEGPEVTEACEGWCGNHRE